MRPPALRRLDAVACFASSTESWKALPALGLRGELGCVLLKRRRDENQIHGTQHLACQSDQAISPRLLSQARKRTSAANQGASNLGESLLVGLVSLGE